MDIQTKNKSFSTLLFASFLLYFLIILFVIFKEVVPLYSPHQFPQGPQTAQDYYMLGKHYFNGHQFVRSIEMSRKALALNPKFGAAFITIGLDYAGQGQFDQAIECYNKAITILTPLGDKHNLQVAYHNIGIMYDRKKNDQKSWEYFHKAYDLGAYKDPYIKSRLDPRVRNAIEVNKS